MGNIGEPKRTREYEPLEEPSQEPVQEPAPKEPAEPEKVPA